MPMRQAGQGNKRGGCGSPRLRGRKEAAAKGSGLGSEGTKKGSGGGGGGDAETPQTMRASIAPVQTKRNPTRHLSRPMSFHNS